MITRIGSSQILTPLNGVPAFLGVIVATTTKNNNDTAAPFNNTGEALKGKVILLSPDTACWINFGATSAVTASTTPTAGSIFVNARERISVIMSETVGWVACVAVTGTTNLQIWELT